ncbi:BLOC-1-related complex subunit 8 isoform X2 [Protopterus annectens]|uniref:BLOC-1-related complex subunit 8 isoform X2 n=2 Tax=Protopterus annectens TaxID=7888 RepID=UPI001CFBB201|nr:BLOC-1-related complex subunit 8 isoform X2 [Protopterus annectens]
MVTSLICSGTESRVSSVLNRDTKQFGKKFLFDNNEETCWSSDQGSTQWVLLEFPQTVNVSELLIQFQGGFAGRLCRLEVTDRFTESMYVLANEPSVALYRLQEHVRRSLPELVQHKSDMQRSEEQSQGAIYTVEYACSAVRSMTNSHVYFRNIESLLRQAINIKEELNAVQGRRS